MTAKDKKEILQIFSEAFEKTAMPVLRRMQSDIRDLRTDVKTLTKRVGSLEQKVDKLDKRIGSLEQKVNILEQKMDAHAAEQIVMHKKINALFDIWDMDKKTLENHEERITCLEAGYARPSL